MPRTPALKGTLETIVGTQKKIIIAHRVDVRGGSRSSSAGGSRQASPSTFSGIFSEYVVAGRAIPVDGYWSSDRCQSLRGTRFDTIAEGQADIESGAERGDSLFRMKQFVDFSDYVFIE